MIDWIDAGLNEWAAFFRDGGTGLGYPSCSAEARVFAGGPAGSDDYVPPLVQLMETAVLSMEPEMRTVVKVAYMSSENRAIQAGVLTQKLGRSITRQKLSEMITQSHRYIAGFAAGVNTDVKTS